jgi:hypothetical protein
VLLRHSRRNPQRRRHGAQRRHTPRKIHSTHKNPPRPAAILADFHFHFSIFDSCDSDLQRNFPQASATRQSNFHLQFSNFQI